CGCDNSPADISCRPFATFFAVHGGARERRRQSMCWLEPFSSMLYCRENVHFIKKKYDQVSGLTAAPSDEMPLRMQVVKRIQPAVHS
ncbi:MAG TPA: hypothetical protein VN019_03535, partial [Oxalicibacterium sp.]|nr:hypothetical protein [Oxalicibacterium sp.]